MFKGSCVALVTPMDRDGNLDENALIKLVEWHVSQGTNAILAVGTTGESSTLTPKEQIQIIKIVKNTVKGQIPVIAGTGTNNTKVTIEHSLAAKELGVDALLVVTPYYNRPTQEGLYQHYKQVAQAVKYPIMLYNVPARTACDLLPRTVTKLSKIDNIIGIKEATGDLGRVPEILDDSPEDFLLYSGDDSSSCNFMRRGGVGVISVAANCVPDQMANMCGAVFSKEFGKAEEINKKLKPLYRRLTLESNPIPIKWALHTMGHIQPGIRLPLTPLTQENSQKLRKVLEEVGAV